MNKLILFLFCALLAWPMLGKDKAHPLPVSMTVVVTPAYTPMLYRHQNHVVLTVTNWVDKPQSLRFRGAITGDNGFSAVTNPEFQPAISFVLLPFQTRSFVLSNAPTVGFLDEANLDINLPKDMLEQLNQGLAPEGSYQLCVQALAYETGIALSDEACFSYNVTAAQPPLTLSPQCGDTVQQQFPVFNWSVPGGAFDPAKIRYDFYLLRLQAGQNDPWAALQQAIVSGVGNPLVKTGLYAPAYALKSADAAFLGKGRYAWAVVARDLSGLLYIDNGGMSNVCGFVYDFPPTTHQTGTGTNPPIATPKNTILKGRLFYTYLEGTVPPLPMNFTTTYSTAGTYQQELQNQRASYGGTLVNSGTTGFTPDLAAELSAQKTAINNIFAYMPPIDKAYPLAGVRVKLELHLIRKMNKNDARNMGAIVVNQAVGEGVTDAQGNFTIAFLSKDSLGQMTKILNANGGGPYFVPVLKLLVLDKHFCSPELNIEVQPGGTTDIGNAVSFVRAYNLNVKATVSTTSVGGVVSPGQPIKSLQLKIGRYHNPDMAIPQDEIAHPLEGDGLKELGTGAIGATINGTYHSIDFDLMVFSKATTDDNGVAHFTRIAGITEELYVAKNPRGDTASMYSLGWGSNKFVPGFGFNSPMTGPAIFNRVYYGLGMPAFNHAITAILKSPIIKGRVFEEQLSNSIDKRYMGGVTVKLYKNGVLSQTFVTALDGKFEFRSLLPNESYRVEITKTGYGMVVKPNVVLNYGDLYNYYDINLKPAQRARGSVMDEYGKPLPCYVQTGNGTIYETGNFVDDYGKPYYGFDMYTSGDSLHLMPKSSSFFPKKFPLYFYAPPGKPASPSWGAYTLYERRHRLRVVVKNEAKQPVPNAVVDLEEFSVRTDNNGVATFNFPSPGNQFYLRVSGLADYAATQKILTNNPSEQAVVYEVALSAAVRLNGLVTAGSNQTPLANAHLVVNSGGREFEAYTNAQGYYEIVGIPRTGSMTVSKESGRNQPLYIGQTLSSYNFTDPAKTVFSQNFNISVREDLALSDIWGFKAEITRVLQGSSSPVFLCVGAITQIPENENFRPKGDLKRVPFSNVAFEKTGQLDSMGRSLIAPKGTQMNLSWSEWTVKLYDQYDATLKNVNGAPIQVQKKDGKGVIEGLVSSELEPFRFSYQYNGRFYLGESANDLFLPVFKAKEPYPYRPFHLMNGDAAGNPSDLAFKMRTFPATASRDSSFVSRDSGFVIRTVLHTNIPGITPSDLKLDIGKIAVTKKGIEIKKGAGNPITIQLEKWRLKTTSDWSFNPNEEGISIPRGNLYTGLIDPVLENLLIKPDFFEVDIKNVKGFTLGGIAQFVPNCLPKFFYDPFEKHYQFSFLGTGNQPAGFVSLPAVSGPIGFNNFTFNSANQFQPSIRTATVKLLEIADCQVNTMQVTPGQIELGTTLFLGLNPEVSLPLQITYTKPGDTVAYAFKPGACSIETPGNVTFGAVSMNIKRQQITALGILKISDNKTLSSNSFNLSGVFTKTPTAVSIKIDPVDKQTGQPQRVNMGAGRGLSVIDGAQHFQGRWDSLAFNAHFIGFKNVKQNIPNHFVVHGGIGLHDGKIGLENIKTPFGEMELVYDYKKMALHGSMEKTDGPDIPFPPITIEKFSLNVDIDKNGFLLYGNGKGKILGVFSGTEVGLMIGYYNGITNDQKNSVIKYTLNGDYPSGWIGDEFGGVYMVAKQDLLNEAIASIPFLSGRIEAKAQIDAMVMLVPEVKCATRVSVAVAAEAKLDAILCDVCVGAAGAFVVESSFGTDGASFSGCGSLSLGVDICGLSTSGTIGVELIASTGKEPPVTGRIVFDSCAGVNYRDPCSD